MLEQALALTREYAMLSPGSTVLCAVSGGADSMCLLHWLSRREDISLHAAHFDHRLRGAESDADAAFVRDWCRENGIPFHLGSADVRARAGEAGRGIEETARDLRYAFLRRTAQDIGGAVIATAHNADDNAETLLLHLVRGTGLQGLAGIPPRRDDLVRPLLTTPREEILAYLEEFHVPYREDSSNADEAFSRNKLRAQVMPVLKELNPRFLEGCSAAIRSLRADNDFLNAQAARVCQNARWAEDDLVIEARYIAELPPALAPRAARRLIEMMGDGSTDCSAAHLNGIVELCRGEDPSAVLFLPRGMLAQRVYRELLLTTQSDPLPPLTPTPLNFEGLTIPPNSRYACRCRAALCPGAPEPGVWYLARDRLSPGALLRPRQVGDSLSLPGREGTKTVKKWLIEAKVPRREREQLPVLADASGVAALAGFGPEASRLAQPGQEAWALSFERLQREKDHET
ncbi:tRNA lysidine(34) synthetase TilS [Pseudoflavonifractor phocaeensis]|uniref:tRNA lysidine(34) synthetase TilS n=1 Tax=Pseudoflavonifractor phocaeensis TaxID=1870988 RepID=UPI00313D8C2F